MSPQLQREKLAVTYGLIMQNTALNLGSRVLPAIVGVVAIPIIIRGLGLEQYGILSLALIIVTYFSLFDSGLGSAITKFVAAALICGPQMSSLSSLRSM